MLSSQTKSSLIWNGVSLAAIFATVLFSNYIFEQAKDLRNELRSATMEIAELKVRVAAMQKGNPIPVSETLGNPPMPLPLTIHPLRKITSNGNRDAFVDNEDAGEKNLKTENIPENGKFTLVGDDKKSKSVATQGTETQFKLLGK